MSPHPGMSIDEAGRFKAAYQHNARHSPFRDSGGGPTWRDQAECNGADPDIFYPRSMKDGGAEDVRLGKALCAACPVQDECLEEAVEVGDIWGWRAGKSPNQIKAMVIDRHGSAPLEGFGHDWHERNSTVTDGKTAEEIAQIEYQREWHRNYYRQQHGLDVPEQRQPEEAEAEVA